ncbi:MAG: pyrrolo-quinoline quinone, partial [Roseiflexaceae bacterium]|nr:pyrrolo-quinoline quinone [Roseiflexaceae bacterium]
MRVYRHSFWAIILLLVFALPVLTATPLRITGDVSAIAPEATQQPQATSASLYLPLITRPSPNVNEWSQHAHNAQRTGYTPQTVPYPWRWRWSWNGPN